MSRSRAESVRPCFLALLSLLAVSGCQDSLDLPHRNKPPRIESFQANPASGDAPLTVQFSSSIRDPEDAALVVRLDFGDGSPVSRNPNAAHVYAKGQYTALLTVKDREGALATASVGIVAGTPDEVSFSAEVYPLFSQSGCAASTCHGANPPAGGLDLDDSIPNVYAALVPDRVDVAVPCNSLLLRKASRTDCDGGAVFHGGGTVWPVGSAPYETTRRWIAEGAQDN